MILFSGHKEFKHRGDEYIFTGIIECEGNESSYTGKVEQFVYDEYGDYTLKEDDNFSADELIDLMEIELPFLYFLEIE